MKLFVLSLHSALQVEQSWVHSSLIMFSFLPRWLLLEEKLSKPWALTDEVFNNYLYLPDID